MNQEYTYKLKTLVEELKLDIIYLSSDYEQVLIKTGDVHRPGLQLAGFYDYFEPARVQLIGQMETAFLRKFTPEERREKVDFYMSKNNAGPHRLPRCRDDARNFWKQLKNTIFQFLPQARARRPSWPM